MIALLVCVLAVGAAVYYYASSTSTGCPGGFEGESCVDIDECSTTKHTCHQDFNCKNTPGSFECHCSEGFSAIGENCVDVDECSTSKHTCYRDLQCRNTPGTFECYCLDGFNATDEDCVDINECERNQACESNLHCTNSIGSYSCGCPDGFEAVTVSDRNLMKDVLSCVDIDECIGKDICPKNAHCNNSPGSYDCDCLDGYGGNFCDDIDECNKTTTCHSEARCVNNEGSFSCSCNDGYYGTGDACFPGQCQDANCPVNQKCVEETTIDCECKEGFRLDNSSVCIDVDECQQNKCNDLECSNTIGSYVCERVSTTSLTTTTSKMATTKKQGRARQNLS